MLPIVLNPAKLSIGLAGAGEGLVRRARLLAEAGIDPVQIAPDATVEALDGLDVLFIAGLSLPNADRLARLARAQGMLLNVEDAPDLCDFHVPAAIRRGDLLLTISTAGKSPGLAKLIREWLESRLGLEWDGRLADVAKVRTGWRSQGHSPSEISNRIRDYVAERDWLS